MKILFLGDIVGRAGRNCIKKHIKEIQEKHKVDFTIVNGENATHGFGISKKHCKEMLDLGIDVITLGNHAFDKESVKEAMKTSNQILRPYNFDMEEKAGQFGIYNYKNVKIMVINLIGDIFMSARVEIKNPFVEIDDLLRGYKLKEEVDIILVDFHAETTSEKNAMGFYLDGKVSAIVGTHTHIPTADTRILEKGTGYKTDLGMCGDYNSVIGMESKNIIAKFCGKNGGHLQPAKGEGEVNGVIITIDTKSGLCSKIEDIKV